MLPVFFSTMALEMSGILIEKVPPKLQHTFALGHFGEPEALHGGEQPARWLLMPSFAGPSSCRGR